MEQRQFLITLSSPIAIRIANETKMVNVVEGIVLAKNTGKGSATIRVRRAYNHSAELMTTLPQPIDVDVKISNIRCRQEVHAYASA